MTHVKTPPLTSSLDSMLYCRAGCGPGNEASRKAGKCFCDIEGACIGYS